MALVAIAGMVCALAIAASVASMLGSARFRRRYAAEKVLSVQTG